jgi:2-hydroxycyclohexanecarboxyl-CoA dehydrogenase
MNVQEVPFKPVGGQEGPRRVALVTGGGGGIGEAIAFELAAAGHSVAIADTNTQRAAHVATEVSGVGVDAIWVEMNVIEYGSVHRALGDVQHRLGTPSIVVNCAGWDATAEFAGTDETYWKRVIEVNLMGAIRVSQRTVGTMLQEGWGRIVNVAGEAGRLGEAGHALMSAANGGLIAFTKALALELAGKGVTVNCVCPGPTATPMLDELISQSDSAAEAVAAYTASVPMGRLGQPQDIAPAVGFLVSEGAAYITGQTLSASGGMTRV